MSKRSKSRRRKPESPSPYVKQKTRQTVAGVLKPQAPKSTAAGVCRDCGLEQQADGWHHAAKPRCIACGGQLDKKYLSVGRGRKWVRNPNLAK